MSKLLKNTACCAVAFAVSVTAAVPVLAAGENLVNPTNNTELTELAEDTAYDYNIKDAYFSEDGKLIARVEYIGQGEAKSAKLIAATYDENKVITDVQMLADINGNKRIEVDYPKKDNETVKLYIWDSMNNISPLGDVATPAKRNGTETYSVSVSSDITGGTVKIVKPAEEASNITEFFVKEGTSAEGGTVYTDDGNINVEGIFDGTVGKNQEEDPGPYVPVTINGRDCCDFLALRLNADPVLYSDLKSYNGRMAIKIEAKKEGKFTIYYRWQSDATVAGEGRDTKLSEIDDSDNCTKVTGGDRVIAKESDNGAFVYGTQTFDLNKDSRYLLWAVGTTSELFGYTFEPTESAE